MGYKREERVNAMLNTWTWVAEEFLPLELTENSTKEHVMRTQWPTPPTVRLAEKEDSKRGRGTTRTTTVTKLCPTKKLPCRAPKTRTMGMMDAVKGSMRQVHRYVRQQENMASIRRGAGLGKWPCAGKQPRRACCNYSGRRRCRME